ncbi:carboxylate-amine ligase [Thalassovita aquimarina]|uniref:Putative glutamate--cysteine ligase 2 n=1 Tax=Thalassovita aquimarina TaxID=2785917 RepID=A0ABS5HWR4_9RHOB|nr:carboxylate-amine ligase [Thalassovita aquimarina]MBR9653404.1 carboxylate-amine ligase [Thalassovita aquimarina]
MSIPKPDFTIGVEEEYLLVDLDTLDLATAPPELMERCGAELEGQFSPEFLDCQVEIGTRVCADIAEARDDLKRLRSTVARVAKDYNLAPIAASCHPFSDWRETHHTDKERYNTLSDDLAGVARRMLICGMHVHVGIPDPDQRIDLMNQMRYFLPHLLAFSGSSPFWRGEDTGLNCYRLTVFDNLPRTGLPPRFDSWSEYDRSVHALVDLDLIEDSSKIWWDMRPSSRFPTIEARICDVSPRLETTLTLAALTQTLVRALWRLSLRNQRWRIYDNFLISENRWRAQRYGIEGGLIDFGAREILPFDLLVEELIDLVAEDADILGSRAEIENMRTILKRGNAAQQQRLVYQDAVHAEDTPENALKRVVKHLIEEFHADL